MEKPATIVLILFMALGADAQSTRRFPGNVTRYSIDIFGGLSWVTARLNPETGGDRSLKQEFTGGLGFTMPFGNPPRRKAGHFELMTRIAVERKDYSVSTQLAQLASTSSVVKNTYLTLSLLPAILLGENQKIKIFGGGYFSSLRLSRTEITVNSNLMFFRGAGTFNSRTFLKNYDAGLTLGAGYSFTLGSKLNLGTQLAYEYGLVNIFNPPGLPSGIKPGTVNNRSVSILMILRKAR